jgi:hypothetical protein
MDTLLAVIVAIVGIELTGVGLMTTAPAYSKSIKWLFWACAALIGLWGFAWELIAGAEMMLRILVGSLMGLFVFVIVPETIRHFGNFAEAQTTQPPKEAARTLPSGACAGGGGIIMVHSSHGTITNNTSHDNQGPNIAVCNSDDINVDHNQTYDSNGKKKPETK